MRQRRQELFCSDCSGEDVEISLFQEVWIDLSSTFNVLAQTAACQDVESLGLMGEIATVVCDWSCSVRRRRLTWDI